MSTLRINSLENASGGDGITQAEIYGGVARAWWNLNGTGTIAERDSVNISSYTDNGTGDYTATFTNSIINTNYQTSGSAAETVASGNTRNFKVREVGDMLTGSLKIVVVTGSAGVDVPYVGASIIGYLA